MQFTMKIPDFHRTSLSGDCFFCHKVYDLVKLLQLVFLQGRLHSYRILTDLHILHGGQDFLHLLACCRRPGTVFQDCHLTFLKVVCSQLMKQCLHFREKACIVGGHANTILSQRNASATR